MAVPFDLTNRTAVVVGGTTGIGRALALGLAEAGANVVATGRRQALVDEAAAAIETRGRRSLRVAADVADSGSLRALADKCAATFGTVDIVVAAAGITKRVASAAMGAEHLLAARASSPHAAAHLLRVVNRVEAEAMALGLDIRGTQPSPGNIRGGLTTIEEKSLGATHKAGERTRLEEVVAYAAPITKKGLTVMDTPGLDVESVTGMVGGGAQVVLFTTGLGTPTGNPIAPVMEFATRGGFTNDEAGVRIGNIFYGTKGWLWIEERGKTWQSYLGPKNEKGPGAQPPSAEERAETTGLTTMELPHYQNFIDAIRADNGKLLACDITEGHLSSVLPHLANISYRVGRALVFDGAKESFFNDADADKLLTRESYRKGFEIPKSFT